VPSTSSSLRDDVVRRATDEPDAVCAAAEPLARKAATEIADPGTVGEHLTVRADGDRTATHYFTCLAKGYRGWQWAVTVSRAPRSRHATVSEAALLPGPDAVQPPAWLPWAERIAPGDLGPADVLPYRADDPYLEFGYSPLPEDDEDQAIGWELGLGRVRVLSREGRDAAATRWYLGDRGPTADEAVHAAAACASCAYFLPVAGSLRRLFGVCANEWSPSDGRVVSLDHGCGAHSETDVERVEPSPLPELILDETGADSIVIERAVVDEAPAPVVDEAPAPVVDEAPAPVVDEEPAPVVDEAPELAPIR